MQTPCRAESDTLPVGHPSTSTAARSPFASPPRASGARPALALGCRTALQPGLRGGSGLGLVWGHAWVLVERSPTERPPRGRAPRSLTVLLCAAACTPHTHLRLQHCHTSSHMPRPWPLVVTASQVVPPQPAASPPAHTPPRAPTPCGRGSALPYMLSITSCLVAVPLAACDARSSRSTSSS